jgi:predicted PhzF superfamily epimerase YddE/YHI9
MGKVPATYIVSQGTVMGRQGRISVRRDDSDTTVDERERKVWIGGSTVICIRGTVEISKE